LPARINPHKPNPDERLFHNHYKSILAVLGLLGLENLTRQELIIGLEVSCWIHLTVILYERLKPTADIGEIITMHDSCYLCRWNDMIDAHRSI
jgi:Fe-S oxidoreductase